MTREQFVSKWRTHLIGKLAVGTRDFRRTFKDAFSGGEVNSDEALGRVLARLPEEADELLGRIWDSLQPANGTNGHHDGTPKRLAVASGGVANG